MADFLKFIRFWLERFVKHVLLDKQIQNIDCSFAIKSKYMIKKRVVIRQTNEKCQVYCKDLLFIKDFMSILHSKWMENNFCPTLMVCSVKQISYSHKVRSNCFVLTVPAI